MTIRALGICTLMLLLAPACGGGNATTTGVTGTTGGNGTTSGGGTTTGGTPGNKGSGAACSSNAQCASGVCGPDGTGNCCTAACAIGDAGCGATACDATGACLYPGETAACGSPSCTGSQVTNNSCDGTGTCVPRQAETCPNNLACKDATSCATTCIGSTDCVTGFYCNAGTCAPAKANGACSENDACTSGVCGIGGSGNCCTAACGATADPACAATACDVSTGACVYATGAFCAGTCTGASLTAGACDATGACGAPATVACPNGFECNAAGTACLTTCTKLSDCVTGDYCNAGACAPIQATGRCSTNDACTSGICGVSGTGSCCTAACSTTDPACGATDCDSNGACVFPSTKTTCGDGGQSCTDGTETNLPACDGAGACQPPTTAACAPFICGTNACFATCTDGTACVSGGFCDDDATNKNATCCSGLVAGGTITVDSSKGSDKTACCGFGTAAACKTISHAMELIDAAQASGVTINASVKGAGGNWGGEPAYPVVLGWGVELVAPGVFFYDANAQGNTALFEIKSYSKNDTVGYASIVGAAGNPIGIGMNAANNVQTSAATAISVDAANTLYIADAVANTSAAEVQVTGVGSVAVLVQTSANLVLGQDQPGTTVGTVTIGNALGNQATDGWIGIFCNSDTISKGCTVTDATVPDGGSSLVVEGQEFIDIAIDDYGSVILTSNPIIGIPPTKTGFGNCPAKVDGQSANQGAAVIVQGGSTFSMSGGAVECIAGAAIVEQFDDNTLSTDAPNVTLDDVTVQNSDVGLVAVGGTMAVKNSTIQFNWGGIEQADDTNALGSVSIDLSGGGNSVVCSSSIEASSFSTFPGISVWNLSTSSLDADNVAWDTAGPDYFNCDNAITTCTCNQTSCTVTAGNDGMDAVDDSTNLAGVSLKNPTVSAISCTN